VKRHLLRAALPGLALSVSLTACSAGPSAPAARGPALPAHWDRFKHVPGVVDFAGPRSDGSITVAAAGRLFTLSPAGTLQPFAQGAGGYSTPVGPEPYIAMTASDPVAGTGCSFGNGTIFALQPGSHQGIILIGADGQARPFVNLPATEGPVGIAFDATGRFGHKLLVTVRGPAGTSVLAIDCTGGVHTITTHAPPVEGGIVVAPASFGRYAGDLVAPAETIGSIFAIRPDGSVATLAVSGLPHGGDIGVESAGFVPPGFGASDAAYLADRFSKGNRHPGTDSILRLPGTELVKAGVHTGDLLVATEGSARTIAVHCASSCTVRYIAMGPAVAHGEGHIVFASLGG
jgi:hypothetical protein